MPWASGPRSPPVVAVTAVAGFAYAELTGDAPDLQAVESPDGTKVHVDPDGFAYAVVSGT